MPNLFELFKFSKQLEVTDGELLLMGLPINIVPTSILADIQKGLVENIGLEKAYATIYESAKKGSLQYNSTFIKKQGFKEPHKTLDWQIKIVAFSGWGTLEVTKVDFEKDDYAVVFKDAAFPKTYGRTKYAVDFVATGFVAGGLCAVTGKDLDAVETKCLSLGDPHCKIEVGPSKEIRKKQADIWKNQKQI